MQNKNNKEHPNYTHNRRTCDHGATASSFVSRYGCVALCSLLMGLAVANAGDTHLPNSKTSSAVHQNWNQASTAFFGISESSSTQ